MTMKPPGFEHIMPTRFERRAMMMKPPGFEDIMPTRFERGAMMMKPPGFEHIIPGEPIRPPCFGSSFLASPNSFRAMDNFELVSKIGQGTYGTVYKAKDKRTGEFVAIKMVELDNSSLTEVQSLFSCRHPSIVNIKEVVFPNPNPNPNPRGKTNEMWIVMEYVGRDLHSLLASLTWPLEEHQAREMMRQLLSGIAHMHRVGVLHRDLKTSNVLVDGSGNLKICDLGLSCRFEAGKPVRHERTVVSLWYRPPELLMKAEYYSSAIDMWSVGCVMAELLLNEPLLPGTSEEDQLDRIFALLHAPHVFDLNKPPLAVTLRDRFPELSTHSFDLLSRLLAYDPNRRITAQEALYHPWFQQR